MIRVLALAYIIATRWTWVRAGWKLGKFRYEHARYWHGRVPCGVWHCTSKWDGNEWIVTSITDEN